MELINLIEFINPTKAKTLKNYDALKKLALGQTLVDLSEQERTNVLGELTRLLQPHLLRRK
jgi:hypothetical protein